ncbi:MAG: DUF6463 family protein [Rubrobacteraceae bacterium]
MGRLGGPALIVVSLIHTAVGIVFYWRPLGDIVRGGLFNAVVPHFDRDAAFWFLMSGALIFVLGQLAWWSQRRIGTLPAFVGWETIALAAVLGILMPVSGWPLVAACGLMLLGAARFGASSGGVARTRLSTDTTRGRPDHVGL